MNRASLVAQVVKNLPAMQETWLQSLGWEDPLEQGTSTHSSILAWRIPWNVRDLGSVPGLGRSPGKGNTLPTPVFWPGEFYTVHGVAKSQT